MAKSTASSEKQQKDILQPLGRTYLLRWLVPIVIGVVIWFIPPPEGVEIAAWHLLAIFVATIAGIIAKPLPMGAVAIIGIMVTAATQTLSAADALSGFGNTTIWLIVIAFFVSRGFIKTGFGARIAYLFMSVLGKKSLGLSYGLVASDLVLAPAIPSNTARAGGVVFPILVSIAKAYGSEAMDGTSRKLGAFLTLVAFQGTIITSAMFLTAMAANPLAAELAADQGIIISWGDWALAALVPGVICLVLLPLLIYKIYPPEIKETPAASQIAKDKLAEMGSMKKSEWIMLATFFLLLVLWILGPNTIGMDATTAALVGLTVLLLTTVLTWDDVLNERGAWDTLVWFAALVMMATQLSKLGFIAWFSATMGEMVAGYNWGVAFLVLSLVYFYSHYLFASNTAHVSAMYAPFLAVALAVGTPPMLAALVLAFFSNLFSSMTHYGTGPAPVLYGSGYVAMSDWWRIGLLISVVNIAIWLIIGGAWWKVIGVW
jgi:divalent anion:Na+ symporter, DASS family